MDIGGEYSFEDQEPKNQAQYRLKIIDLDGIFEYSKIISLELDCHQGEYQPCCYLSEPHSKYSNPRI